jgi:hypothetical protein
MEHPSKLISLLEKEILRFSSDNNARKILSKYSVNLDEEKMQKALVIWSTEFRHLLEKWRESLPDDPVEAEAFLARKKGKRVAKNSSDIGNLEVIDEEDL